MWPKLVLNFLFPCLYIPSAVACTPHTAVIFEAVNAEVIGYVAPCFLQAVGSLPTCERVILWLDPPVHGVEGLR